MGMDFGGMIHQGLANVWSYKWLMLALLVVGLVLLVAFFIIRAWVVPKTPKRVAVRRTIKKMKQTAQQTKFAPKYLKTRGSRDRRIGVQTWGRTTGGYPTASVWIVSDHPTKGFFRRFRTRVNLIARHLVDSVNGDVLEVKALSMSPRGLVRWPNEDLADSNVREAWEPLLLRGDEKSVPLNEYQTRINDWYNNVVLKMEVVAETSADLIDVMIDNVASSMARDFARAPQRHGEIYKPTLDDPLDPASESVPRA